MLDLGIVAPGETLNIPFATYDSNDPSASVTTTGLATTDIEIYKDGSLTQRASDVGYAVDTDFDALTGLHTIQIDLSDNTTAGFFAAGSEYLVAVSSITVDAATVSLWAARFKIGIPGMLHGSTIAVYTSTDNFTLNTGSANDDAYNGCILIAYDVATEYQMQVGVIEDYTGATKTVNLKADPGVFTMTANDNIIIMPPALLPTTAGTTLDVTATGGAGIDWANVENPTTAVDLSGTDIQLCDTVTTLTGHTAQTGDSFARIGATGSGLTTLATQASVDTIDGIVDSILVDTGTTLDTKLNDIQGATFSSATDSLEAIRDRGDAAWTGSTVTSDSGTAQAGAAGTITLQAGASAIDDTYNGQLIYISSGTGAGQSRAISDYTGSSKVANVVTNWGTTPDNTSVYSIYPDEITEITAAPTAAAVADAVWDENTAGHTTGGTFGEQVKSDIDAILVDTGELQTDWTNAGRLDTILDTINSNVTTVDGLVDELKVATITNAAGVDIAADVAAVKAETASILADTATLGAPAGASHGADIAAIKAETALIVADTNELQTDDIPTTLATLATAANLATVDTVVDAIKAKTDSLTFTVAGEVDANVESINATAVVGVGTSGNKWRA